jgi:hypothetical protein
MLKSCFLKKKFTFFYGLETQSNALLYTNQARAQKKESTIHKHLLMSK